MLKQTITYDDFDGHEVTEDLYFNLTKTELTEQMHLIPQLESLQRLFQPPVRQLTMPEIRSILDMVKLFAKLSYGVRSEDGRRFSKREELWIEFTETAAYDAFLLGLFTEPEKAVNFMVGVLPQDMVGDAKAQLDAEAAGLVPDATEPAVAPPIGHTPPGVEPQKWTDFTKEQLLAMNETDFRALAGDPLKMPHELLLIAFERKSNAQREARTEEVPVAPTEPPTTQS